MRAVFSVLSLLFVVIVGCATSADPPSPATSSDDLAGVNDATVCPTICGEGTLCSLPNGSCTEVCNACFCTVGGGKVVAGCPGPASALPAPEADGDLIGQACGPTVCGLGTHCCNASCGICVPPGGVCTQQFCGPTE
jgi:hypothetical protein